MCTFSLEHLSPRRIVFWWGRMTSNQTTVTDRLFCQRAPSPRARGNSFVRAFEQALGVSNSPREKTESKNLFPTSSDSDLEKSRSPAYCIASLVGNSKICSGANFELLYLPPPMRYSSDVGWQKRPRVPRTQRYATCLPQLG